MRKMKKKCYLKLKDNVDHQVLRPANFFRYIQTVDGRFSDSSDDIFYSTRGPTCSLLRVNLWGGLCHYYLVAYV